MSENSRANKTLCDLPFSVTMELMQSMDPNKGWEGLAAAADFTFDRIQQLALKQQQSDGSPTRTLLWELGCLNYKVVDLHDKLKIANRFREMRILEAYVKEGGQDNKGSSVERKISDSLLHVSLPQQLSQFKVSAHNSQMNAESGFNSSGSEINFNHPSAVNAGRAKLSELKNYGNKIIPGTTDHSLVSSCGPCNNDSLYPSNQAKPGFEKSISGGSPQIPFSHGLNLDRCDQKSIPPSLMPGSTLGGVEKLQQMLESPSSHDSVLAKNTQPSSLLEKHVQMPGLSRVPPVAAATREGNNTSPTSMSGVCKACFRYRELLNATGGFSDSSIVGQGAFGTVYRGNIRGVECAIKKMNATATDSQKKFDQVMSELAVFQKYQHENIVTLYGYAQNGPDFCLVYQYLIKGSLEDRLLRKDNTPSLSWERRLNVLVGACNGLNFLHTVGPDPLIHGDIKSPNILLDQYFEAKLGDLGQAKYATSQSTDTSRLTHITLAQSTTKQFGSRAYLAPELMSNCIQSIKSDVYALGVVFLEVCSGLLAYDPKRTEMRFLADYFIFDILEKDESLWKDEFIDRTLLDVPDVIFNRVLKLASRCLKKEKKLRPETLKVLNEMKDIYNDNKEITGEEGNLSSMSSSLQIDSHPSVSSLQLSHDSRGQSSELNCASSEPYKSAEPTNVQLLQEQRMQQFQSIKAANSNSVQQHQKIFLPSQQPGSCIESSPSKIGDVTEMRNRSDPESPLNSFPPNTPIPEALRLQVAYDSQPERKRIDRLSALSQAEDLPEQDYPSDLQKLNKIEEFDKGQKADIPSQCGVVAPYSHIEDNFPQADPKKLAQLNAFDEANFGTTNHEEAGFTSDPAKLAYLQNFDEGLFKASAQKEYCSHTEQKVAMEAKQVAYSQNEYASQTAAGQPLSDFQTLTRLPLNPTSRSFLTLESTQVTSKVVNKNGNGEINTFVEFQSGTRVNPELITHAGVTHACGRLGWESSTKTSAVDVKLGKDKMNSFFDKYSASALQTDDDGGDDNEAEEFDE